MNTIPQMEFRLLVPKTQKLYSAAARDLIANCVDGLPGMNVLFNRTPEGRLTHNISPFRFSGSEGLVRIFAIGELASEWLEDHASLIRRSVSKFFDEPIGEQRYFTDIFVNPAERTYHYKALNLVTAHKIKHFQDHDSMSDAQIAKLCAETLAKGIERQIEWSGLSTRGAELPISITHIGKFTVASAKDKGYASQARTAVEFSVSAELKGNWAAGNLMSTGRGLILPLRVWKNEQATSKKVLGVSYVNI